MPPSSDSRALRTRFIALFQRRVQEADLVVINHHLLCADFALRDDGFGEILPAGDAWIDKLPFAAPRVPMLQARIDALAAEGGNPFMDYRAPQAAPAQHAVRERRERRVLSAFAARMREVVLGAVRDRR